MVYGYVRVSTEEQDLENQKNEILRYTNKEKMFVDEFIEIKISSTKKVKERMIFELIDKLKEDDIVIVSELSRLARSTYQMTTIIKMIVEEKKSTLITIKNNITINGTNIKDPLNKIYLTVFSLMYELERDFISERTKTALQARKDRGMILGKRKGTIQKSIFDVDAERIVELMNLGVSQTRIVNKHLGYGTVGALNKFLKKKTEKDKEGVYTLIKKHVMKF